MFRFEVATLLAMALFAGCSSKPSTPPMAMQNTPPPATSPDQPGAAPAPNAQPPAFAPQPNPGAPPAAATPQATQAPQPSIDLAEGTVINVRLGATLDTKINRAGEKFTATLASPIVVEGKIAIPKGTNFYGRISESKPSGRLKGRAVMDLRLEAFELNGRRYGISTSQVNRVGGRHKKRNIVLIGGGAGAGASIGAIAGGPAGALIGAGAGAGAGTVGAVFTGRKNVRIPVETLLHFRLREPVPL